MSAFLGTSPQVLAFLQDARERPEDDTPRLVLADYLEEYGDHDRAEFLRLQCRLAAGPAPLEEVQRHEMEGTCDRLLVRHGGGWLGPLWQWSTSPMSWHRGLLSLRLPRGYDLEGLIDILPWIDTALFVLHGRGGARRVADLMTRSDINHLHLDLRSQLREDTLHEMLAKLPESGCLRTLSIHWPLAMLRRPDGEGERPLSEAAVGDGFLAALLGEVPLGRHLTHLGTSRPFGIARTALIRGFGVEPVHAQDRLWMHRLPPAAFRARGAAPSSSPPPLASS
jgi:uncharacterized protein (TIGR02996 family)